MTVTEFRKLATKIDYENWKREVYEKQIVDIWPCVFIGKAKDKNYIVIRTREKSFYIYQNKLYTL